MIDFKKVKVENIEGVEESVDLSKAIAQVLFMNAPTPDVHELSLKLNKTGQAEKSEFDANSLRIIREKAIPNLPYFATLGINKIISEIEESM